MACDLNGDGLAQHFSASDTAHHVATVTGSVTDAAVWKTLVGTAKDKFGGLDIVINNAGTSYRNKATADVTEAEFDRCFSVNVKSVFLSVPACVPALEERGGGAIINVASIGASRPRPGLVWYNASKGAVANVSVSFFFPFFLSLSFLLQASLLTLSPGDRQQRASRPNTARSRSASTVCCRCSAEQACLRPLSASRSRQKMSRISWAMCRWAG